MFPDVPLSSRTTFASLILMVLRVTGKGKKGVPAAPGFPVHNRDFGFHQFHGDDFHLFFQEAEKVYPDPRILEGEQVSPAVPRPSYPDARHFHRGNPGEGNAYSAYRDGDSQRFAGFPFRDDAYSFAREENDGRDRRCRDDGRYAEENDCRCFQRFRHGRSFREVFLPCIKIRNFPPRR